MSLLIIAAKRRLEALSSYAFDVMHNIVGKEMSPNRQAAIILSGKKSIASGDKRASGAALSPSYKEDPH